MQIWEAKANECTHKTKDLFSWRWDVRRNWGLIERVQNNVRRALCFEDKHFFETFYHSLIARFRYSTIVRRIESGKYVATGIGPSRKLDEERRKQVVKLLFIDVPKVEIKIGQGGTSSVAQDYDILYD